MNCFRMIRTKKTLFSHYMLQRHSLGLTDTSPKSMQGLVYDIDDFHSLDLMKIIISEIALQH